MSEARRVLTSVRNPRVIELAKLHDARRRRAAEQTLVEGPHQLADVLAFGASVVEVFHTEEDADAAAMAAAAEVPATAVSQAVLRRIAGTDHPRGPVAVVQIPEPDPLVAVDTVVLWDVRDPGNTGAIVRTAAALGYAIAVTPGTADVWGPKAIRSAAATQFGARVSTLSGSALEVLESAGLHTMATVAAGGEDPSAVSSEGPVAVLIGNEAHGLPDEVAAAAATRVTVPLQGGVESLNAAVAAALTMYALKRG